MNSHELNSIMIYIHPPLSIIGYIFIFLFAVIIIIKADYFEKRVTRISGLAAWIFTFLGLVTGMLWAQVAWGSYWSWDPKETMTFALFLALSAGQMAYFEKKKTATKYLAVLTCILVILTALSTFIIAGLHSFA
jgi:ABC-type transport system involved in cytochrome c biogenesis permease subunit